MAVDGNFAGGFAQGIQPLIGSLREDRRQRAQNDFQQKLLDDRQTAQSEIRKTQREDTLARGVQQQQNFETSRKDSQSALKVRFLGDDKRNLEGDFLDNQRNAQSTSRDIQKLQTQWQKAKDKVDKEFEFDPTNPMRANKLNALNAQFRPMVDTMVNKLTQFGEKGNQLQGKITKVQDALRNHLLEQPSPFAETPPATEVGNPNASEVLDPATGVTPPPENKFNSELKGQADVFERTVTTDKVTGSPDITALRDLKNPLVPVQRSLLETDLKGKLLKLGQSDLATPEAMDKLTTILGASEETGAERLIALAGTTKGNKTDTGENLFAKGALSALANPTLDKRLQGVVAKETKALNDSISGNSRSVLSKDSGMDNHIFSGLKKGLGTINSPEKLEQLRGILRRQLNSVPKNFFGNEQAWRDRVLFHLERINAIDRANSNLGRVSGLRTQLGAN